MIQEFNTLTPFTQICLTIYFLGFLAFMAYFWKKFTE